MIDLIMCFSDLDDAEDAGGLGYMLMDGGPIVGAFSIDYRRGWLSLAASLSHLPVGHRINVLFLAILLVFFYFSFIYSDNDWS